MKKLFVLLSLILCFSGALSAKLLIHFEFENSLEDSVGDNNGTFTSSGSSIYNTGRNGKALVFNGTSDYMEFGKGDFNPRYAGRYSISMWVYSTEQASSPNHNSYIGKHTDSGGNSILFGYWDGQLSFRVRSDMKYISAAGAEPENTWVHYAVSAIEYQGTTTATIYKNGTQIWSGVLNDIAGTFDEDDKPWVLGMDWDSATSKTDFFKGRMDNVRLYSWNITDDEVKEIYLKESAKLHLKMDGTVDDSAGSETGSRVDGAYFKQGMENQSIYFDGVDDYVQFGTGMTDPRNFGLTTRSYSISMWVKSDSQASSLNDNAYILKQTDTNEDVFRFGYWNNFLMLKIRSGFASISNAAEPTSWTHYVIAATENLSTSKTSVAVYKNGSQLWTGTVPTVMGLFSSSYKPWTLGRSWGGNTDFFEGEMDNVRFYSRVLTEADAKALYRSEFSGVRYCNTDQNSAGCTIVNDATYDLSQYSWFIYSGTLFNGTPLYLPVFHTSIESIKVSEGWEAYLCTQPNHQGECHYYDDGFYNSPNLFFPSSIVNNVYSMTVQPSSFSTAKKFFGYKRADGSGNYPTGFAYIYGVTDFEEPTKANEFRRLFLNSYDRYNFSGNLQHTIISTNRAASVELYGEVYLEIDGSGNTQNAGYLMTSHNDFRRNMSAYPELDFRQLYNNVDYTYLHGKSEKVGSVGLFRANDSYGDDYPLCLRGVAETIDHNPTRIECVKYGTSNLPFDNYGVNNDQREFWERIYSGNKQKFERYVDNYSLLMLSSHGEYSSSDGITIYLPYRDNNNGRYIQITGNDYYSKNLGKQYTRWLETTACQSMGVDGINLLAVGNFYYNILTRLNGIGGYRNNSWWGGSNDDYTYYNHWRDLTYSSKAVSKAWIDSWSESLSSDHNRDARFVTLEKCDCSNTSCTGTYMKNDYFYNVSTGPKAKKSNLSEFTHYCFRDKETPNFNGIQRSLSRFSQDYPEEFSAYTYDSLPNYIVEQLFDIKIDENTANFRGNDRYNYKDDYVILTRMDKNIQAVMNREMVSFEDEKESEDMIWDKFNEAKYMAETLTSVQLEYEGISRDVNEAFEVGGNGESLGKMINSAAFVFRPVIDDVPIFAESIEVEYDAEGFYQLRSNVPYSVSKTKKGMIKSEYDVETEIYSALGKEEEKIIAYVLNEENEFVLSVVAKDEVNKTFLTISLEENHD